MESPGHTSARLQQPRNRINLGSKKIVVRVHKANNKTQRTPRKPKTAQGSKKNTTARIRVDLVNPNHQNPPELWLPPPIHALTENNLRAHTQHTNPSEELPVAISSNNDSSEAVKATIRDAEIQLAQYGFVMDSYESYPSELENFIRNVVVRPRNGPSSPAAKLLHQKAPLAQRLNEWDAMGYLAPHLGFLNADEPGGAQFNHMGSETEFSRKYVMHSVIPNFVLPQPRVDKAMGYMSRGIIQHGRAQKLRPAFTEEEEMKILGNMDVPPINQYILCPWYSIEFKSFEAYAGLKQGKIQLGRNSIAACEYTHRLYVQAGVSSDAVDTMHWALVCDTKTVELFVVWREQSGNESPRYHMRREFTGTLEAPWSNADENPLVVELRNRLHSIFDYVSNERLTRIKQTATSLEKKSEGEVDIALLPGRINAPGKVKLDPLRIRNFTWEVE
ncbi:hypothetical protein C7974DRAFT_418171 [Boeremia exigua]|uniref:uncharacterized protein n=1 Tax=Boeremia exigua TaxID=749465 RepID=UPI001E8E427D|nr:uncharacterized protein C7974DRAFT_418171 [Boeremia exigua]KAH6613080.1 hypothetical protein C7974DRAFT_418171 [Boeremia exigua]